MGLKAFETEEMVATRGLEREVMMTDVYYLDIKFLAILECPTCFEKILNVRCLHLGENLSQVLPR